MLAEWSDLREVLGLKGVPHFTTLCSAAKRLLRKPRAETLLAAILRNCHRHGILKDRSKLAAIDAMQREELTIADFVDCIELDEQDTAGGCNWPPGLSTRWAQEVVRDAAGHPGPL